MPDQKPAAPEVISFGAKTSSEDEARYRKQIADAQKGVNALKGTTPVGGIERPIMPNLGQASARYEPSGMADGGVAPRPPGSPPIRSETQAQIAAMQEAQKQQAQQEPPKLNDGDVTVSEKMKDDIWEMFDFAGQNEAERILNNRKRRQEIESRCSQMLLEDLIMSDEVQQDVIIVPSKLTVRFRSLLPTESLFIKQFTSKDKNPNDAYALEKYAICQLACALVAINGKEFPDHRDSNGEPDEKLFENKLKLVMKKSGYLIADLGINFMWFDVRVRKLLAPDALGNG